MENSNEVVYEYCADAIPPSSTINEASLSEDGSVTNYSTFNSNLVENTVKQFNDIKVTHSVDKLGREFYLFDDSGMKPMAIVVISVNDIVLPLDEFLDISHIKQENINNISNNETADFREIVSDPGKYGTVACITNDEKLITITNSNVKLVMMALSILSKKFGYMVTMRHTCPKKGHMYLCKRKNSD
jgi:hypothetical protein